MTGEFPTRRQAALLVAAFAVLGLLPQALSRTLPDIAFPLWAADRMQHGARLYVDILEINPPLFIWLDLPLTWLARVTGLGSITWYRIATSLLLFASLGGCWWALNRALEDHPLAYRRLLWLAAAFSLLLLPRLDWGEREHLSLALTLPYILLGIARARGRSVPRGGAILSGLAAGVGIAFKPHFVLVWVGREIAARAGYPPRRLRAAARHDDTRLKAAARHASPDGDARTAVIARAEGPKQSGWLRARHSRESGNPLRWTPAFAEVTAWETALVPLVCIAYLVAVILIHPEYFHLVRELGWAYSRFLRNPMWIVVLQGHGSAIVLGAIIVALALRAIPKESAVWRVLIGAMLGYSIAAVLQAKGWRYHLYPAIGLAMLLFAVMAWDVRRVQLRGLLRLFGDFPISVLITAVLVTGALAAAQLAAPEAPRYDADPNVGRLVPVVRARAAGRPVYVLSPNMASGFPLIPYAHAVWPARLPHLWPAVVTYDSAIRQPSPIRLRPIDDITPIERFGLETTARDFVRSQAPLVLTLIPVDERGWGQQRVDVLGFMLRDSRFRTAWMTYDSLGQVGDYLIWARRGDSLAAQPLPRVAFARSVRVSPPDLPRVDPYALFAGGVLVVMLGFVRIARRRRRT